MESLSVLKLESKDKQIVEVDRRICQMSELINDTIEINQGTEEAIPIHEYSADTLKLVAQFCELAGYENKDFVKRPVLDLVNVYKNEWETKFFEELSHEQLFELVEAANFLNMPKLVDGCCAKIAVIFKTAAEKELTERYGPDFKLSQEEEDQLKEEYPFVKNMDRNRYKNEKELNQEKIEKQVEELKSQ
eukprot:403356090